MSKAYEQALDNEMSQQETFVRFGDVENGNYTKFNEDGTQEIFVNGVSQGVTGGGNSVELANNIGAGVGPVNRTSPTRRNVNSSYLFNSTKISGTTISPWIGSNNALIRGTSVVGANTSEIYEAFDATTQGFYSTDPQVGESLDLASGDVVVLSGSKDEDVFKPQKEWAACVFIEAGAFSAGGSLETIAGKVGDTFADGTFIANLSGDLYIKIGGEKIDPTTPFDLTQFDGQNVMIYLDSYYDFDDSTWRSDCWINNNLVFNHKLVTGTTVMDLDVIMGARWSVDVQVDSSTDSFQNTFGSTVKVSAIHLLNKRSPHGDGIFGDDSTHYLAALAFFHNPFLFDHHVGIGDSFMDGGTSSWWWAKTYFNTMRSNHNVWFTNLGDMGDSIYEGCPDDFVKPSWVTGSRNSPATIRNVTKAGEIGGNKLIIGYASNDVSAGNTDGKEKWYEIVNCLNAIHKEALKYGMSMFTMSLAPRNAYAATQLEVVEGYVEKIVFGADIYHQITATDGTILPQYDNGDGTHLNEDGNTIYYNAVYYGVLPISGV